MEAIRKRRAAHRRRSAWAAPRSRTGSRSPSATASTSTSSIRAVDPAFAFMTLDHDGKIRMDCSSPYAMASLVALKDRFDIAWGNDADVDRHGIVTPSFGLMNPNHYLAVAIEYLLAHRPQWSRERGRRQDAGVERADRPRRRRPRPPPARGAGRLQVVRAGLLDGSIVLRRRGERRGASFLRRDGSAWTTDKDGIILGLLAAEITAVTGKDPGVHYRELAAQYGAPHYVRIDAPATPAQKAAFKQLTAERVTASTLAGEPIVARLTRAPATMRRSAASRSRPPTAGSRRGRRAPRTSTRSTPRASRAPSTSRRSSPRRSRSSATRWPPERRAGAKKIPAAAGTSRRGLFARADLPAAVRRRRARCSQPSSCPCPWSRTRPGPGPARRACGPCRGRR